jgi:hypothetical protein
MVCYGVFLMTEIFLPVMGRAGRGHVDPEIFVVIIAFLAVLALSLFTVGPFAECPYLFSSQIYFTYPVALTIY